MVSSIGSYSSASAAFTRPDPSQMASKLFSKLDTKGQGYIEESDLQSAFSQVFSATGSSSASSDASSLFSALDSDSNGQVTESEFSSSLQKLADALDSQAFGSRMSGGMGGMGGAGAMGGMPPPPREEGDAGLTKDQLSSQLEEIGSTDSQRSSLISNVVANFEAADANGDGKVSRAEAMAYQQSSSSSTSSASSGSTTDTTSATTSGTSSTAHAEARMMHRLMELMRAYGTDADSTSGTGSSVAVSA
ncbi:MAG: EF-hand domain-containing protein [Zoogloea sp.]|nr:MAG: EF-hand domain-containing protein [Zoogloea sp.]